jgi:hypothetical protein
MAANLTAGITPTNMEIYMKVFIATLLSLTLLGCSTNRPALPPPTDTFKAVGNYSNRAGALKVAMKQANKFCKHFGAAPAIITQDTKVNGNPEGETFGGSIARSLKQQITGEGSATDFYETTVTYKCY